MPKVFSCRDVGMECGWHICADTEEEVLRQAAIHARDEHDMPEISDEMRDRIKAAIKEGPCPTAVH